MRSFPAILVLAALTALPASAATFMVNDLGDAPDQTPGNGVCATAGAVCTLRAAIMESNAFAGIDSIRFSVAGTISPATPMTVTDRAFIIANTAPGYASAPVIIIDGGAAVPTAFEFAAGSGASQLAAFEIRGFSVAAVDINTGGIALHQNYIGPVTGGPANQIGVRVGAAGTAAQIGDPFPGYGNVISGNGTGILINGANGVWIRNNVIGTNPAGTAALPNGVGITANASALTQIGLDATTFNLISGNSLEGVVLNDTTDAFVAGNRIGTDVTGLLAIPNADVGVTVSGGTTTTLGTGAFRNIISGNGGAGVLLTGSTRTTLANNWIGIGSDGVTAIPNDWGIVEMGTSNMIGTVASGNVLSGNLIEGILLNPGSTSVLVQNNYIGLDATGTVAVPNGENGIFASAPVTATIGGSVAGAGNVISGNTVHGITGDVAGGFIGGNLIGLSAAGSVAVPNGRNGIALVSGTANIGLPGDAANTISGNTEDGIHLSGTVTGVTIRGNRIGTNMAGTAAVPNVDSGIDLLSVNTVTISENVISGNTQAGVDFEGTTQDVVLTLNTIGRDAANTAGVPNGQEGLRIRDLSSAIVVGDPGLGNVIASNIAPFGGVLVTGSATAVIRANSIFDNGALGIDLEGSGVTPNDALDADVGPNTLQNFPLLNSVVTSATQSFIGGTLHSTPSTTFTLDFFSNPAPDPSGFGEGQTYLGSAAVTTDALGNAPFTFTGPALAIGAFVTSTATAVTGTSEFSGAVAAAALSTVQFSSASSSVAENAGTATITVTRTGDLTATSTVSYTTADGTATAGSDYTATSGTLTFAPGVASQSIVIPILDDLSDETDEALTITLSSPSIAELGTPSTATLTITDDDGAPSISVTDVSLAEGNAGTTAFAFTVSLSNPSASAVSVDYATANDTAAAGSDYTATSGTLNFAAGETTNTITVLVTGDIAFEPGETFFVNLTTPVNATIGDAQGVGTILNDDNAFTELAIAKTAPATAAAGGNVNYTITVSNAGPDVATTVTITDVLPVGTTFVSATPSQGTCNGTTTVTCNVGPLAAGASTTVALIVRLDATAGSVSNTASVATTAETDSNLANNAATATTTVSAAVAVAPIPTLSEWLLLALAGLLSGVALLRMRA